ncbi:MAG: hypothetical protein EAZ40_12495, partial [Rhodobacterales bacterium]
MDRRSFTFGLAAGLASPLPGFAQTAPGYRGPNVILVRFGGGVRRAETIDEAATWAPYLRHSLAPRGTFIPDLRIDKLEGVNTSHAEGTLNLLQSARAGGTVAVGDNLESDATVSRVQPVTSGTVIARALEAA